MVIEQSENPRRPPPDRWRHHHAAEHARPWRSRPREAISGALVGLGVGIWTAVVTHLPWPGEVAIGVGIAVVGAFLPWGAAYVFHGIAAGGRVTRERLAVIENLLRSEAAITQPTSVIPELDKRHKLRELADRADSLSVLLGEFLSMGKKRLIDVEHARYRDETDAEFIVRFNNEYAVPLHNIFHDLLAEALVTPEDRPLFYETTYGYTLEAQKLLAVAAGKARDAL